MPRPARIAVIDDWLGVAADCADWRALSDRAEVEFFSDPFDSPEAAATRLGLFDIVVPMRERLRFDATLLDRLPNLKLLALTGFSTRHVDMETCARRGILCCGSGGASPASVAELTFGLMIGACRNLPRADALVRAGGFQAGLGLGEALEGKTIGVIGLGHIGGRVATLARAFGMEVLAWSQNLTAARAADVGVTPVGLPMLLERSDVVTLHLILSPRSRHILGAAALGAMKPGALLINTSRAGLVDEAALIEAVSTGRIRAALDVFDHEPLPSDHPLRTSPNTVLSPHLGFSTREIFDLFYPQSLGNILAYLDGKPIRVLNPPAPASS